MMFVILSQKCVDFLLYFAHRGGGAVAGYHFSDLVYEELGEVLCYLPGLLLCEVFVERICIGTINLHLLEAWEFRAVRVLAELVYHLIGTGTRLRGLVRGEVQNLKTLGVILAIQGLQVGILWGE